MALKAGRVGLHPSQVDKNGMVIGGGASVYAFIIATYNSGETCTITDGVTTLTSDTSGRYVFPVTHSGQWVVTSANSKTVDVSEYGESYEVYVGSLVFDILSSKFASVNISMDPSEPSMYVEGVADSDNDVVGMVFKFNDLFPGTTVTISDIVGAYVQKGICMDNSVMPNVVNSGTGRGPYTTGPGDITPDSGYPSLFVGGRSSNNKFAFKATII